MEPETTSYEEENPKRVSLPFMEVARRILLASVGAAALAQDEIEDFVNRLVDRGELAEKDGRTLVREIMDRRKREREKFQDEVSQRVEQAMHRMNMPTKADIDLLNEKISALNRKIDELKKSPE